MRQKTENRIEKYLLYISAAVFLITTLGIVLHLKLFYDMDKGTFDWFDNMFEEPKMNFMGGSLNNFMTAIATYGDVLTFVILAIVSAAILLIKRYYVLGLWILGTIGVGGILGVVLKDIFHRNRPYDHLLVDTGFSFPSGHSLSSTLIVMMLFLVFFPKIKHTWIKSCSYIIVTILWISILFSRMYFHAHFLSDVIGGVSFGTLWVMLMIKLYQKVSPKLYELSLFKKSKHFEM